MLNEGGDEGGVVEGRLSLWRIYCVGQVITAAEVLSGSWKEEGNSFSVLSLSVCLSLDWNTPRFAKYFLAFALTC